MPRVDRGTLRAYYQHAFPKREFCMWLGYGRSPLQGGGVSHSFVRREFSFTFGDIFTRFQCFRTMEELQTYLCGKVPDRMELGAIYTDRPGELMLGREVARREFVIDIDLTDMPLQTDTLNPGDPTFAHSWRVLALGVRMIDRALREDFGFRHILWVFSGRRGVHCWVADQRALAMTNEARAAITSYLSIERGGAGWRRFASGEGMHPRMAEAADSAEESGAFKRALAEQGWMSADRRDFLLGLIVDDALREEVGDRLSRLSTKGQRDPALCWHVLRSLLLAPGNAKTRRWRASERLRKIEVGKNVLRAVILGLVYPVLDAAVSRSSSHLLKAPFTVHPATGYVCVPLDPATMADVDPATLPGVEQVALKPELLHPYCKYFKTAFLHPLHKACVRELDRGL